MIIFVLFDCSNLTKLGKNIEIVSFRTFYNCPELEEVILPDGVKLIQKAAFFNCKKLSKINLPQSILRLFTVSV